MLIATCGYTVFGAVCVPWIHAPDSFLQSCSDIDHHMRHGVGVASLSSPCSGGPPEKKYSTDEPGAVMVDMCNSRDSHGKQTIEQGSLGIKSDGISF